MNLPEILPCPWCGHESPLSTSLVGTPRVNIGYIHCGDPACDAAGPVKPTPAEAITAWNQVAGLKAEVAKAKEDYDAIMIYFRRYGEHDIGCPMFCADEHDASCTCAFTEIVKELFGVEE